jgi:hypothetical protein
MKQTKQFGIYHWDTFDSFDDDGGTILVAEADTLAEAEQIVEKKYKGLIRSTGADYVEIVNSIGKVVRRYRVG